MYFSFLEEKLSYMILTNAIELNRKGLPITNPICLACKEVKNDFKLNLSTLVLVKTHKIDVILIPCLCCHVSI